MNEDLHNAYLAGIFDGEGSIEPGANEALQIGISQNNYPFLEAIKNEFGGNVYPAKNQNWQWQLAHRKHQEKFLKAVQPYVILRREEVLIALRLVQIKLKRDDSSPAGIRDRLLRAKLFELLDKASDKRRYGFREKLCLS